MNVQVKEPVQLTFQEAALIYGALAFTCDQHVPHPDNIPRMRELAARLMAQFCGPQDGTQHK